MEITKELLNDFVSGNFDEPGFKEFFFSVCSALAYKDPGQTKKYWTKLKLKSWFYDIEGAQCYVLEDTNKVIVAFRGTEPKEWNDIKADLSFRKTWHKGSGKVHRGFMIEVWKLMDQLATKVYKTKKTLYVTGHSLGGAMATLYADVCRPSGHVEVYTYGAPRCGDEEFCRTYVRDLVRVRNNNDMVPTVPLWSLGFRHIGETLYINHYGYVRNLTGWQKWKDRWRGRFAAWRKLEFFDGIRDHSIDKYAQAMHRYWTGNKLAVSNEKK